MANEKWGTKRACPKCTTRFYDLSKDPMTCPACGATFDLASILEVHKKPSRESTAPKNEAMPTTDPLTETEDIVDDDIILDDDDTGIELEDDLLEEDEEESVSLEEIADVATANDET